MTIYALVFCFVLNGQQLCQPSPTDYQFADLDQCAQMKMFFESRGLAANRMECMEFDLPTWRPAHENEEGEE